MTSFSQGSIPYKLLRRVSFPYENYSDNSIRERTVFDKLRQFISEASSNGKFTVGDYLEIPLETILPFVSDCCSTTNELELVYVIYTFLIKRLLIVSVVKIFFKNIKFFFF